MATIGRLWTGRAYGTNTGNIFIELLPDGDKLAGTLRFADNLFGLVVHKVSGQFDGSTLTLEGDPIQSQPGVTNGHLSAKGVLTPEGHIRGEWNSSLGTAGTFEIVPNDIAAPDQTKRPDTPIPEQLNTSRVAVGAVRLYADELRELIQSLRKDFTIGRVVVTYNSGGIENVRYAEDFEREAGKLDKLRYLKLVIQEPEAHGINRFAMVELSARGENQVVAQGIYESWVLGKAELVSRQLRRYQRTLVTTFKVLGVGLNQLLLVAMLIALPEITPLWRRAAFTGIVVGLLLLLLWLHRKFLPNAVVSFEAKRPGVFLRVWPSILSWLVAASAALAASYAFYRLTGHSPP